MIGYKGKKVVSQNFSQIFSKKNFFKLFRKLIEIIEDRLILSMFNRFQNEGFKVNEVVDSDFAVKIILGSKLDTIYTGNSLIAY